MASALYRLIYSGDSLHSAWRKVRSSALSSTSKAIQDEAKEFESRIPKALNDIQRALSKKTFVFQPQMGIAKTKTNGKSRPVVLSPIPNRIVQRALLDALQTRKFVREVLATPTSYGGIPNKRVAMAISDAKEALLKGAAFHIRSDVAEFFTKINKDRVIELLEPHIKCSDTMALFQAAINTDLINIDTLRKRELDNIFPLGVEGVAQGSPLSPLVANLYLSDFDKIMNSGEVVCLRYIDDFLILGRNMSSVDQAFNRALKELEKLSLSAYLPSENSDKASRGWTDRGFDFLGCHVLPSFIQPSRATRDKFKKRIKEELEASVTVMRASLEAETISPKATYSGVLQNLDRIILGWGMAFSFCDDGHWMKSLDEYISNQLSEYEEAKSKLFMKANAIARRRMLGVRLVSEAYPGSSIRSK